MNKKSWNGSSCITPNSTSDANAPLLREELQELMERYPD